MTRELKCAVCDVTFSAHRATRLYCSKRCKRIGIARKTWALRLCERCGQEFQPEDAEQKFCGSYCRTLAMQVQGAKAAGRVLRDTGEGKTYRKLNGRHEHRIVAERMLGRSLRQGEVVHHIDGDHRNNDPSNLTVLPSQAEHARLHALQRKG